MAKELYLYSSIYDFIAQDLIAQMEEFKSDDIIIRSCSPGGSVFAGWGIIAKMTEHEGSLKIKCDGMVASMALFMLLFCDDVECLDVTSFVLHRADMYVGDPEDQAFLDGVNAKLKEKLTAKIDSNKLFELKGVTIKDIFSNEGNRLDVVLTASEAKQIGLINKIVKMTPAIKAELKSLNEKFNIAAKHTPIPQQLEIKNPIKMTKEKLKAEHPDVYVSILAEGISQEKDRVEACLVFNELDPAAVKLAIESGKPLSQKAMADFALKAMSVKRTGDIEKDSQGAVTTGEPKNAEETKKAAMAAFEKEVDARKK